MKAAEVVVVEVMMMVEVLVMMVETALEDQLDPSKYHKPPCNVSSHLGMMNTGRHMAPTWLYCKE
jgi:hypothetical protein